MQSLETALQLQTQFSGPTLFEPSPIAGPVNAPRTAASTEFFSFEDNIEPTPIASPINLAAETKFITQIVSDTPDAGLTPVIEVIGLEANFIPPSPLQALIQTPIINPDPGLTAPPEFLFF